MTEIAQRDATQVVIDRIREDDFKEQLQAALPEGLSVEKFARVTATALMDDAARQRDPDKRLTAADRVSLYQAVIKCAQDGLLPDGREAALVKRGAAVSYMPMVGGLRKIAGEHGWTITARVVCENDEFEHVEEPPSIRHAPVRPGVERGAFVAAYAVARHKDGRRIQRVLYAAEVQKRMAVATTNQVWNAWTEQMWEKTAARDVFADLPFDESETERIARVVQGLDPGAAAQLLYGPSAVYEASPAALPAESGGAADGAAAADSQAAGGDHLTGGTPPAAPLDDVDDSDAPGPTVIDAEAVEETDPAWRALADVAAGYRPAGKKWPKEMTLAEIHQQPDGADYIAWAARDARAGKLLQAAALDYTRVYLPEAYHVATAQTELSS